MQLELTKKQYRRLLDMVYIGNWVLNATRGEDRFTDYDEVETFLFSKAAEAGMGSLAEVWQGEIVPSKALAEDLARRDMDDPPIDDTNYEELAKRIDAYIAEFEEHGTDNVMVDVDLPGAHES